MIITYLALTNYYHVGIFRHFYVSLSPQQVAALYNDLHASDKTVVSNLRCSVDKHKLTESAESSFLIHQGGYHDLFVCP